MTLTRAKPAGWANGEIFTSTQANAMDVQLPYAVDGNAGGTYAPSNPIVINGDGLDVGGAGLTVGGVATTVSARLLTLEDRPFLRAALSGSGLTNGSKLTPTSEDAKGSWTIASNDIEVPQAGWYQVAVNCYLTSTNTSNPYTGAVYFTVAGLGGIALFKVIRWSATAADAYAVSGSGLVQITTPSTQKISIQVEGGGTIAVSASSDANQVHIACLAEI
jgi:hypothetical protein